MGFAAIDGLEDAIDATRAFLLPFDGGRWLRLAIVVLFLSGGAGTSSVPNLGWQFSDVGEPADDIDLGPVFQDGEVVVPSIPDAVWALALTLLAALLLVGLVFVLVGSVMEFVLVESLRAETVRVRAYFRRYLRAGLALFGFRLLLGLVVLGPLTLLGVALFGPVLAGGVGAVWLAGAILFFVLVALLFGLVAAIVHGLTVEFVVPVMVLEECGIIAGWRRLWPTVRRNLSEVLVYIVVRFGVAIAVGIIGGTVTSVLSIVVLVPLGLIGGGLWLATGAALTPLSILVLAILVLGFFLLVLAVATVVQVPLKTYTRYYELMVLGDLNDAFDLIPDRRAAIRETATEGVGGAGPND